MASDPVARAIDNLNRTLQEQTREFKKMTDAINRLKPKLVSLPGYFPEEVHDASPKASEASAADNVSERGSD